MALKNLANWGSKQPLSGCSANAACSSCKAGSCKAGSCKGGKTVKKESKSKK